MAVDHRSTDDGMGLELDLILRDPNTHPKANDEYNPWNNPDPSRAFILATGFANQRGNAVMLLHANSRRRFERASRRHASG